GHPIARFHADPEVIREILRRLLAGEELYDQPARLRCKDGSIKHVLIHSNALWEDGKFVHSRCFTRDVTQRVLLEQEVRASIAQAIEACRPTVNARGHRLTVTLPEEPIRILGDLTRLVQVFSNILNNAAKYTPKGGHIHVSAQPRGGRVELRVRDNGVGIAPDLLPRVFDLFSQ